MKRSRKTLAAATMLCVGTGLPPGGNPGMPGATKAKPPANGGGKAHSSASVCEAIGLDGPCFAYEYRLGAEYLFLLNRVDGSDVLTPYWIALGPTNEQIRGPEDPWVRWVREQLADGAER